jgi:hypothetical protein
VTVAAVVAVPAAPLLLPAASPGQPADIGDEVARLRACVAAALAGLPPVDAVVLLVPGTTVEAGSAPLATLGSYGIPSVAAEIVADTALLDVLARATGAEHVRADRLDGDAAVLALLLAEVAERGSTVPSPVATLRIPSSAGAETLGGLADVLVDAVDATGRAVAIVATGDLAATLDTSSPGYLVDGAVDWDARAVAAVRDVDADALAGLGPDEAARVQARGWAPLVVLLHVAKRAGLAFADVTELAPRGVGQLVAH